MTFDFAQNPCRITDRLLGCAINNGEVPAMLDSDMASPITPNKHRNDVWGWRSTCLPALAAIVAVARGPF